MGYLRVNITNIVSPNPFKVSFKSVVGDDSAYGGFTVTTGYTYYHNGTDYSSYNTCPTYPAGTTSIEISSNGLDFNSNCWVKIEDTVTKTLLSDGTEIPRYIIENIYLHDPIAYQSCCPQPEALTAVCYHDCYPPFSLTAVCVSDITPTPTPTNTPTPTPTPTPTSTPTPTPTVEPCADCVAHDVTIGSQIWAGCNLDVTTYRNGDTIPQVTDPNAWAMLSTGAWCYYENNSANGSTYGKLYNIYAILDSRGIAPVGYRVPNNNDWTTLTATLGGGTWIDTWGGGTSFFQPEIGSALAEANGCHWMPGFLNPTNSSGFTALPGGSRATAGYFVSLQGEAIFASSTLVNNTPGIEQIWGHTINNIFTGIDRSWVSPNQGISVRLIKD